jgi:hypothetical protein
MSVVMPAINTYARIETLVRRLTALSSSSALPSSEIQTQVNTFYNSDFPYAIKLDQMRSVYTFYSQPYIDRYPLDVNYNQGVRAPVYVDGIQGYLFKDRDQFYNMWPRWPTRFNPIAGDGTTATFSFTVPGPFLSKEVILGGTAVGGNAISVADDGNGNLQLQVPNPVVSVPPQTTSPPVPGMYNTNTRNPGLLTVSNIGSVNYVTGACAITFPAGYIPASGTQITMRVSQYQTGRPYSLLFWNNTFTIRPIPKFIHKVEVETYLTPVQFMLTTDSPILNQWVQYISYGCAVEILRQRQDMEGVENLMEGFKRQEALVLERQGVEEIGQRNTTIFSGANQNLGWNNGFNSGWY